MKMCAQIKVLFEEQSGRVLPRDSQGKRSCQLTCFVFLQNVCNELRTWAGSEGLGNAMGMGFSLNLL